MSIESYLTSIETIETNCDTESEVLSYTLTCHHIYILTICPQYVNIPKIYYSNIQYSYWNIQYLSYMVLLYCINIP